MHSVIFGVLMKISIDYENVSMQLNDHIIFKQLFNREYGSMELEDVIPMGLPHSKCFTFSLPSRVKINTILIGLRNSIFIEGKKSKAGLKFMMHYPRKKTICFMMFLQLI